MINYTPFWATLQKKNITKYQLIYHWNISSNTFRRMSHNEPINTTTLNQLCLLLNCKVQDILKFEANPEELETIQHQREEINNRKHKKHKKIS